MSTTYGSFTPAERAQARSTDLAEFLRRQGYDLKREGRGFIWMNGCEKVSVQGNLWYNQYTREGGDAIDFARRFFDCPDYPSAVRLLLGADVGVAVINPQKQEKKKEQKPFTLPPANSDMHRIYAYLMKQRGIDRDVIHAFTHAKLLYEEATYHNCVFVGYDENGIARHAHKRGTTTGSRFKCNADGSNPQYSFHWSGSSERLFVFEAPIDLMSYISMYPQDWQKDNYVALCSVAPIAARQMIEQRPELRQIILCLDNDDAGNSACLRIAKELKERYSSVSVYRLSPEHKDFNEDLQAWRAEQETMESEVAVGCLVL